MRYIEVAFDGFLTFLMLYFSLQILLVLLDFVIQK